MEALGIFILCVVCVLPNLPSWTCHLQAEIFPVVNIESNTPLNFSSYPTMHGKLS